MTYESDEDAQILLEVILRAANVNIWIDAPPHLLHDLIGEQAVSAKRIVLHREKPHFSIRANNAKVSIDNRV